MTTTLDVLNHMLNVIGEDPVTSASSTHPSVISAKVQLDRVNREVQTKGGGWWFNTEYNLKLSKNGLGQIVIPAGTRSIEPVDETSKLVRRGDKLYDPVNHTFILNVDVYVNAVIQLSIEDLPDSAAMFIQQTAAFDFYVNDDGDREKSDRLEKRVLDAWAILQQESLRTTDVNALNSPAASNLRYRMQQRGTAYNPNLPGGR